MTGSNKLELQARLVRRAWRRLLQMLRYRIVSFQGMPVLFANSFPKSGTHLLTQVLHGFTHLGPVVDSGLPACVTFAGDSGEQRSLDTILADLDRLLPGDIAYGHLHARPELRARLCQEGMASYFILRDPRDVVVSHVHYITMMEPGHVHHRYFTQELHSFEERLRTSILGVPGNHSPFPDIRQRFLPYLEWLKCPDMLSLRYEDFITDREQVLGQVLDHAIQRGFPTRIARPEAINRLSNSIDPQRSPTFRKGKIGGWRDHFTPSTVELFKSVTGDLLVQLGYENGPDW